MDLVAYKQVASSIFDVVDIASCIGLHHGAAGPMLGTMSSAGRCPDKQILKDLANALGPDVVEELNSKPTINSLKIARAMVKSIKNARLLNGDQKLPCNLGILFIQV